MADFYVDYNGSTLGFGAFGGKIVNNTNNLPVTQSTTGQTATSSAVNGSVANTYSFGGPGTNVNTSPGTTTINLTGTFNANGLLYQNLTGDQTIITTAAGTFTLGGTAPFIQNTASGKFIISIPIQGTTNWEKRGASTLQLNAVNTFSGGMTIAVGTVEIGNASALGTGTVTMTGGKLSSSSTAGYTVANALSLNGTMTLGDATNTGLLTFSGTTTIAGTTVLTTASTVTLSGQLTGSGTLTKSGSDNLFLTGSGNNNNGNVTISAGNVLVANYNNGTPNQLGSVGTIALGTGGGIQYCGNTAYSSSSNITGSGSAGVVVRNTSATGFTFNAGALVAGTYTGAFTMYADGNEGGVTAQTTTFNDAGWTGMQYAFLYNGSATSLTQTFKHAGTTTATMAGSLYLQTAAANQVAVLQASSTGNIVWNGSVAVLGNSGGTMTLEFNNSSSGTTTFGGTIADGAYTLNVRKSGTGTATFSGANSFDGSVSVTAGTLNANSTTALGSTSGGAITVTSGATLSLGAAPTYSSRSLTISGTGSSSAPNNGALVIANTGTSVFQNITLGATGTYIRATSSGLINAAFTSNNNSVVFGTSAGSNFVPFASLSNVFSGTGSVTYGGHSLDTGIVRADVRHTYTGNTTLAFGTTSVDSSLELPGTGGPLGNKSLTAANTLLMTGGTLSYLNGTVDYSGRFSTAGSQQWKIDVVGKTVTYATALVGASSLSLSDASTGGSLTLSSASSTFSGGVTITSGTLYAGAAQSGVSGPLGITGTITFSPAGTGVLGYTSASASFDYASRFATTAGQTRRVNVNGESVTFSTAMGGANAFALVGSAGTLTLAVANTYSQGTTLSVGTLKCGNAASLGTGGLAQANNTTLHVTASGGRLTIQGAHTNTGTGSRIIRIGA